jgi:hypothetical protein
LALPLLYGQFSADRQNNSVPTAIAIRNVGLGYFEHEGEAEPGQTHSAAPSLCNLDGGFRLLIRTYTEQAVAAFGPGVLVMGCDTL